MIGGIDMYTTEEWQALSTAERVKIRREWVATRRKATYWDVACFIACGLVMYAFLYILAC